ncbi:MAG: AAA family ATPase [Gammaproteobacteria bacterium]|nr:AAA family ATPase [Gammaproteobacteria bacterium]MBT7308640.1 AAA family ATPase [Gammaproteobacteria bacterium]
MGVSLSNIIIMGVSGAGKTTLGRILAERLQYRFIDADDYHSAENIASMAAGTPLSDTQRYPWLIRLSDLLQPEEENPCGKVLACSALKSTHRALLMRHCPDCRVVWLYAERSILEERVRNRQQNHFMPPQLIDSQLQALEVPDQAIAINNSGNITTMIETILAALSATPPLLQSPP